MQLDTLQPLLYRLQSLVTMEVRQYALIIAQAAELVKGGLPALQIIKEDTMQIKINPDNVAWAMYCPAWANVNGDDAPVMEFRLKTGGTLKISVSADTVKAAVKIYPAVCCELTPAQVKAALSNIDKEGCND